MSPSKGRVPRSACGERREPPSSTHLGSGGQSGDTVRGRPGLLSGRRERSPKETDGTVRAGQREEEGLCSESVSELTVPGGDQAEAGPCLQGYHRGSSAQVHVWAVSMLGLLAI